MTEWVLIWFLTVEKYNGEIDERGPFSKKIQTYVECTYESKEKLIELEQQIGGNHYITETFKAKIPLGGKLIRIQVGCQED